AAKIANHLAGLGLAAAHRTFNWRDWRLLRVSHRGGNGGSRSGYQRGAVGLTKRLCVGIGSRASWTGFHGLKSGLLDASTDLASNDIRSAARNATVASATRPRGQTSQEPLLARHHLAVELFHRGNRTLAITHAGDYEPGDA